MPYDRDSGDQDYGRDRDRYSSARDYAASYSGEMRRGYGQREYGPQGDRYAPRDRYGARDDRYEREPYRGSYGSDGHRELDDRRSSSGRREGDRDQAYGRPRDDDDDRGFIARAGDEVRSWFGDEDAERRRERDARADDRQGSSRHDHDYHSWRQTQVAALDRDYDEYRRENSARFESEFQTWRTTRQGQRDQLSRVTEHQEVLGSDGQHVGTVDKVRDDRIILTKNDKDAGGHHHSIPSRWIAGVDTAVRLSKTAAEAKQAWVDEEANSRDERGDDRRQGDRRGGGLNRSFSGTY